MAYEHDSSPPLSATSSSSSSSNMPSSELTYEYNSSPPLTSSSNMPSGPCPPPKKKPMAAIQPDQGAEDLLALYTNGSRELPAEPSVDTYAKTPPPRARFSFPLDEDDQRPVKEISKWEDVKTPAGADAYLPLTQSAEHEHARMRACARRVNQKVDDFMLGGPPQSDKLPSSFLEQPEDWSIEFFLPNVSVSTANSERNKHDHRHINPVSNNRINGNSVVRPEEAHERDIKRRRRQAADKLDP
ncbi:hypothetical protein V8F33_003146 [Rhypophila sp. PSN 637]